jgi:hypothetical protein
MMSQSEKNKIEYIILCAFEFAQKFNISTQASIQYLLEFKGIEYLQDYYEIEHTLPLDDTMEALATICARNGGGLA